MRRTHYLRERSKLDGRAKELKAELDQVIRKIAALDLVWNEIFSQENGHALPVENPASAAADATIGSVESEPEPQRVEESPGEEAPTNGALSKLIEQLAVRRFGPFGVRQIEEKICALHPNAIIDRTTIAGKLRRLVDVGKLELLEQGRGRKASVFRSKDPVGAIGETNVAGAGQAEVCDTERPLKG